MKRIVVPVFVDVDLEEYEIMSDRTTEGIFYNINSLVDFIDNDDKVKGTEISSGGIIYVTPLSKQEVEYKLMYDEQEL